MGYRPCPLVRCSIGQNRSDWRLIVKQHFVVLKSEDGGAQLHRMKEWLRQNPAWIPQGLDPTTDTSHILRAALSRSGWKLDEKADQVLVIKPDDDGSVEYANTLKNREEDDELTRSELETEELTFGLERDLQKTLRANIAQLEGGLTIIDGGIEKSTEAGKIDITARDAKGRLSS
jgi:hypothetical protein